MKNVYDIIKRPVITEQSMESVADKKYVFMVDVNSNKTEIKAAVEEVFHSDAGQDQAHRRLSCRQACRVQEGSCHSDC